MDLTFKQILLFLLFLVVLNGYAVAEAETESLPRIRTAPVRNTEGGVIDGTGTEDVFGSDGTTDGLGERKVGSGRVSVSSVALLTLAMAAATGLGAVPFFFVELDPQWAGICNGMAAGVMLAASFDLIQEGQEHGSGNWVVIGILTGAVFIWLCKKVMTLNLSYFWKGRVHFQFCCFFTISPSFSSIRIVIDVADADANTDYIWHNLVMLLSLCIILKHVGPSFSVFVFL